MDRQPISQEGYDRLRAEIDELEAKRPGIVEAIASARAEGDLSENAEYHGQREALGLLEAKLNELKATFSRCYVLDPSSTPDGIVAFGKLVTVLDLDDDFEEVYQLVGPKEDDFEGDIIKISTTSPVGQALMGKKVDEVIEVPVPKGTLKLRIVSIENP